MRSEELDERARERARVIGGFPEWKSHKIVRARSILSVAGDIVSFDTGPGQELEVIIVEDDWLSRYKGTPEDRGFFVVYEDGYESWSPTAAFEKGYSRLITNERAK